MSMHLRRDLVAAGAFIALAALAQPVLAQNLHEHQDIETEQLQKADALWDEATVLMESCDRGEWLHAAGLFLESAKLRPCHDPKVFQGKREAAMLFYYLGDYEKAHETLRGAAAHAVAVGDLANAAEAYIDAAYAAARLGLAEEMVRYVAAAEDISQSPFLGSDRTRLVRMVATRTADIRER